AASLVGLAPRGSSVPGRDLLRPSVTGAEITARRPVPVPGAVPEVERAPEPAPRQAAPERAPAEPARREPRTDPLAEPFAAVGAELSVNRHSLPLDSSARHYE